MTTLILGIGNEWASDDGVGPEVVRRLQDRMKDPGGGIPDPGGIPETGGVQAAAVDFRILAQPDLSLLDLLAGYTDLLVVDAVVSGSPPGTVHRQQWQPGALESRGLQRASSHGFGVRELLEMGAVLGKLPARVEFVGIEITSTEPGRGLSPEVEGAVDGVVEELVRMLGIKQ